MKLTKLVLAAAMLALFGAGCASESPSAPQAGTPTTGNSLPERRMAPAADDYQLPDGFPSDFPRYGNSKIISALHDTNVDLMSITSEDEPSLILAWYGQAITRMGFDQKDAGSSGNMTSQKFIQGDTTYTVNVQDQGASASPRSMVSVRLDRDINR